MMIYHPSPERTLYNTRVLLGVLYRAVGGYKITNTGLQAPVGNINCHLGVAPIYTRDSHG